ncbi:MAG: 3-oxoacyl-[acyl-carrier-protein] reductase [Planctomycetes bacterium RBG_16_64_10]|nr:MAG: 3-oxoacyl-[acyl-carrier-protein] reductase [Planctomycetes bacterium RBG_16_64_10]
MPKQPAAQTSLLGVDLTGQVAVVTGASRGIGRAVAGRLAGAGATVVCVARTADQLEQAVRSMTSAGARAEAYPCDVTAGPAVQRLVDEVSERLERLDILVNNAGITRDSLIPRMTDEQWDDVICTNLRAAFLLTRAVTRPMMHQRYGRIINMASVSGLIGNPGQANYCASKAGLIGMTRTVARELASRKITVNAICPGFIATEMTEVLGSVVLEEAKKRVPAKRLGTVEEVADAALYLASQAAAYITGQVLTIDGGLTA